MTPDATRLCPDCGAPNALDAEACVECNHPLDPLGRRFERSRERSRPLRPQAPLSPLPGAPVVQEEKGKVIPRRRHTRAGFLGIGGGGGDRPRVEGGAPGWIWAAVGAGALLIALFTAIGITSQRSSVTMQGADAAQLASADSLARILRKDPDNVPAQVELGNLYYDTKNFGDAIGHYDAALARDSSLIDVAVDRAVALHQTGKVDEAVAALERIVAEHPHHAIASFDLGVIYEFQGRVADAARAYRDAAARGTTPEIKHVAEMRLQALEKKAAAADSSS